MPRDRRRGRRSPSRRPIGSKPSGQPSAPAAAIPKPLADERLAPAPKVGPPVKQAVLGNPHLTKDLRNIGLVAVLLVAILVILSIVLR